ncbi:TonB-dependent receptor [Sphingomonas profundi]|uniref:TonB-dependent receptor n=1 Tax=Alterirhizorhabdus profundi TaxID=2681549 RepID=UPI0012E8AB74|nr:TonB-dependent receptor [Sphingomonas profundi]
MFRIGMQPRRRDWLGASALCLVLAATPAIAQDTAASPPGDISTREVLDTPASSGDIIVTARKKDERLLDVPVAVTALGSADLNRYASTSLSKIGEQIPQVAFDKVGGGGNGATFSVRGVGSASGDKGIEQTVAVNIDGVQSSRGKLSILSFFDVQQVEVLKGPQALFFGKNSPGGVISVRSVDPGRTLEGYARAGYEFKANERFVEGAIGGPLSDTLGLRIALRGSKQRGWIRNNAVAGPSPFDPANPLVPADRYAPAEKNVLGRATLLWKPTEDFSANLKVFLADVKENNETAWQVKCGPGTVPSDFGVPDPNNDCKVDGNRSAGALPPAVAQGYPGARDGQPYADTRAALSSLTLNYDAGPLGVTSVTGFYIFNTKPFDNFDGTVFARQVGFNPERTRSFSEELRVASSFDGPLDFTAGAYFETQKRHSAGYGTTGDFTADPRNGQTNTWSRLDRATTDTYSVFGQLSYAITDTLDLTGGARYTNERKKLNIGNAFINTGQFLAPGVPAAVLFLPEGIFIDTSRSDNNVSPEATLTWKPRQNLMIYGAYKSGFKSGGLSSSSILAASATRENLRFRPEKAKGGEIGAKGEFFDRRFTITAAIYRYTYTDLQSTSFDAVNFAFRIKNAGAARTTGAEIDLQLRVSEALRLTAAAGYNRARYTDFVGADCYAGQTVAQGCINGLQDLTGEQLPRAPNFAGNAGFIYDSPITEGIGLGLTGNAAYTDSYWINTTNNPLARQGNFWRLNASVRLHETDDKWELAFIGRNLTNKYYGVYAPDKPGDGVGQVLIGTARPRELLLQGTVRF